ncbi:MAG: N-acetylmuramoyl-L-alanine amidase [Clostridia bacterium]|nr:N-acetylmuramoyl-L-alanine amidase [Clostridia bacterium]
MKKAFTYILVIITLAALGANVYFSIKLNNLKEEIAVAGEDLEEVRELRKSEENRLDAELRFGKNEAVSVCIDAGHGITDRNEKEPVSPGSDTKKAANVNGATGEEEFNLAVALLVEEKLSAAGIHTDMTRTTHECDKSNVERALQANNSDYCIRIHADGNNDSAVHGISVLIPEKSYYDDADFVDASKIMAQFILDETVAATGAKNNGLVIRGDLTGFNWSKIPVILIECGFMSNPEEKAKLQSPEYQEKIAQGIADGFLNYIKKK